MANRALSFDAPEERLCDSLADDSPATRPRLLRRCRRFGGVLLLALVAGLGLATGCGGDDAATEPPPLAEGVATAPEPPEGVALDSDQFGEASIIYFKQCAGCHGTLRAGATGPSLEPAAMQERGSPVIEAVVQNGLPGGMPPWGNAGFLDEEEVSLMARYLQMNIAAPPQLDLDEIRESWKLEVPVDDRPSEPQTTRDWTNYTGVILRDAGKVAILDADTREQVAVVNTGFAVHILRSSASGRYFYAIGRDGKLTLIDLWYEVPEVVAEVKGCIDARSVESSKFEGFEDKFVIEGCYWPNQFIIFDGLTLEPKKLTKYPTETFDTGEELAEVRVAAIVASDDAPQWVVALKESGFIALVDYSKDDFPIVKMIEGQRFLHDGGFDHTGRYFAIAANERNQIVVVDLKEGKRAARITTGIKPHPGRGANWKDPEFGWVMATTHIGEGKMTVYGADPVNNPEHAWKVVREVELPSSGTLFLKTHPKSPWVWTDATLSTDPEASRTVCAYSKAKAKIEKCFSISDHGRATHFEYNKQGTQIWVSNWDKKGEVVVYDDKTLKEVGRVTGLETPTGKFNVNNTANDIY
ncbi:MAG: nitrite reductase [Thermoleophilia bacterium]|nr:nitrite reductase [Thermoleophilia bacterium]MDH3725072.1 nitrite reductase [Thermoleophilia bacterium]